MRIDPRTAARRSGAAARRLLPLSLALAATLALASQASGRGAVTGFRTSLRPGMTIRAPYTWRFSPGAPARAGYFWADGRLLAKIAGPGPYRLRLSAGMLASGVHELGQAWDVRGGGHRTPRASYRVLVSNPTQARPSKAERATPAAATASWARATSFARPAFTPTRRVDVRTAAQFWSAWSDLTAGEEIDVHGVTFAGEAVFSKQLPGWAEVHFDADTRFTGTPGRNLPAAWVDASRNVRFYGGDLTNPTGGAGIVVYDSSHVTWWNFRIHDTASTGLFVQGIHTVNDHLDFRGEISNWGLNLGLDPHAEKGTGLHGANLGDARYGVRDSRFALYLHDGRVGAGVEAGGASSTDVFEDNTLYLRCRNLTMRATSQVAGNCLQLWGENVTGNDFRYIAAENLQGRPYDANGMYAGQSLATDRVVYGRATNTNLNPALARVESGIGAGVRWDPRGHSRFGNVAVLR